MNGTRFWVFLFFCVALARHAACQEERQVTPIGFYIDLDQNEVDNYTALDYNAPTYLNHSFSNFKDYLPGCYYDQEGIAHVGEIWRDDLNETIYFRASEGSDELKIKADDFTAFTVALIHL